MKKLQAITLCAIFGLGTALAAPVAQDQSAPQANAQHERRHADPNQQVQFMTKKLNLTTDQQNQLLPILTDRQQQIQAIRSDNTLSQKDRREKIRSVMQDSRSKIEGVLNDQQKQTWQQMREHARDRHEQKQNNQNS